MHTTPKKGEEALIFSIYIGWADFLESKFSISIYFGVFNKNNYFLGWRFLWIFFGFTSKFDYFMGYLLKSTTFICVL